MHADEPAAALDEGLECGLLVGVEHVTRRGQKNHRLVAAQGVVTELGGVLAGVDRKAFRGPEPPHQRNADCDRFMPVVGGLREHEDAALRLGLGHFAGVVAGATGHRQRKKDHCKADHRHPSHSMKTRSSSHAGKPR